MHTHLEESLQHDIDRIRDNVLRMANLAETALRNCVAAFTTHDRQQAYAVILRDQYINEKEKEIDRLCLEFIVRQQPVALQMRFVYSTIKINLEIERIGDYAESIARHILNLNALPDTAIQKDIVEMANLSISMFHNSIRAFIEQNAELARENIETEEAVDTMRRRLNGALVKQMMDQQLSYDTFDPVMSMIKRIERVSDQARNICMEVLYICTGEYVKHPGAEVFRVLFIDDHNRCRSLMAEAIAAAQNQPRFIFTSAGIEPLSIDHATVAFMKDKGFDLTRAVPRSVHQIPNLEHYQVIVALSEGARTYFPKRLRKTIFLDWLVDDCSKKEGDPAQVTQAYENTFQYIQSQVNDLINAIIGAEKD
ncbi:MAG: phosphate signaling complex protein PhoU [Chitinispirillaceae bacterium]|jgi:phosphate transport system protein|nr:phosphate signaling complex protein PhoU [Chitinispirillaceae bacterium]